MRREWRIDDELKIEDWRRRVGSGGTKVDPQEAFDTIQLFQFIISIIIMNL